LEKEGRARDLNRLSFEHQRALMRASLPNDYPANHTQALRISAADNKDSKKR
jgi:hypothetical protein